MSADLKNVSKEYAERVCNGEFPITYSREQVVNHTANDFTEGWNRSIEENKSDWFKAGAMAERILIDREMKQLKSKQLTDIPPDYVKFIKPIPLDYWIFYAEKLPLKAGFYETKDSGDDRNTLYHGGDGLPTPWYIDAGCSEKYKGFISYWRPVQNRVKDSIMGTAIISCKKHNWTGGHYEICPLC